MLKKIATILFVSLVGISFLSADSFLKKDFKENADPEVSHPFQKRSLYHVNTTESPLIDSLLVYIDRLGENLNGVVLIARNDTILAEKAFGTLELFKNAKGYAYNTDQQLTAARNQLSNKMTSEALFDLASISKQFTAAAILHLCYHGKIQLTDTLGQYISGTPYGKVTIQQLLSHNSGIPEYFNFSYTSYNTEPFVTNNQLVRVLKKQPVQWNFTPGNGYNYCNTNYALLASVVTHISQMPFEQYVRDNLLKPAGMKNTYFFTELVGIYPNNQQPTLSIRAGQEMANIRILDSITNNPICRGHFRGGLLAQYDRLNGVLGDKGIYTTAEDLVRWTNAYFIEEKILPKSFVQQAISIQNKTLKGTLPKDLYGYGLHLEEKTNGFVVYHGGLWNGFHNLWLYRPKDHIQIVFLSNFYNASHVGQSKVFLTLIDQMNSKS